MKIRMKTVMAGPGISAHPGQVIDVERSVAYALCEGGYAEQVDPDPVTVETAAVAPSETADLPKRRGKRKP